MKLAVATESKDENLAKVSPISGRASYYLIYDDKKLVKTIKNPFKAGGGGAGSGVAQMLTNEGVELVVSGKLGEKMIGVLVENGIKYQVSEEVLVKNLIENL